MSYEDAAYLLPGLARFVTTPVGVIEIDEKLVYYWAHPGEGAEKLSTASE